MTQATHDQDFVLRWLADTGRRMRRLRWLAAVAALCVCVLLVFAGTWVLDWWFRPGAAGRTLWLALNTAAVAGAAMRWIVPLLRERWTTLDVALAHERAVPQFDGMLVTASDPAAGSPAFRARVFRRARPLCERLDPGEVVPWRRHRTLWGAALLLAGGWLLAGAVWPAGVGTWAARTLAPWSEAHWPTRTRIAWIAAPERVRRGDAIRLVGRCAGYVPGEAVVRHRRTGGRWRQNPARVAPDGRFEAQLPPALFDAEVEARAYDGLSPLLRIEVVIPPDVAAIETVVTPPAYSGLPARTQADGHVEALIGSNVTLRVTPSRPVVAATVTFHSGLVLPMAQAEGEIRSATFSLLAEDRYAVTLADRFGFTNEAPTVYDAVPLPDRLPVATLVSPPGEKRVTPLTRLAVTVEGEDDYGVTAAELVWRIGAEDDARRVFVPLAAGRTVAASVSWDLAGTGARPGDRIAYWAELFDAGLHPQGARAGQSPPAVLIVVDAETLRAELAAAVAAQFVRLEELERSLLDGADTIAELARDLEGADFVRTLRSEQWRHEDADRRLRAIGEALDGLATDLAASHLAAEAEIAELRASAARLTAIAEGGAAAVVSELHTARALAEGLP